MAVHITAPVPGAADIARLVVEFLGLPGAGKSHLARTLADELRARGESVSIPTARVDESVPAPQRLLRKSMLAAREAVAHPRRSAAAMASIRDAVRAGDGGAAGRSLQWLVTARLLADARRMEGVHLLEEGLTQALWSIGSRGDVGPMLEHAGTAQHFSDVVVVVDAPLALVRRRLEDRSSRHSRLQRAAADAIDEELAQGETLLDRLVDWWRSTRGDGGIVVVKDSGGEAVAQLVKAVVARATA